jgi:GH24 family phage-related lysozyme (muramidase)
MATKTIYRTSQPGKKEIKLSEGRRLSAYQCSANVWTIGDGIASTSGMICRGIVDGEYYKGPVCEGLTIMPDEADRLFDLHIADVEERVSELIEQELTQGQFDAVMSFVFNLGVTAFIGSTLRKKINLNPNNSSIPAEFMRWINAAGKPEPGLYMRRAREAVTYIGLKVPQWMHQKSKFGFPAPFEPSQAIQIEEIVSLVRAGEEPTPVPKSPSKNPETVPREAEEAVIVPPAQPSPPSVPVTGAGGPLSGSGGGGQSQSGVKGEGGWAPSPQAAESEAKNPMASMTIWGAIIAGLSYFSDPFIQIGTMLMSMKIPEEVKQLTTAIFVIAVVMIVLGRLGASKPLDPKAPIRKQP